MNVNVHFTPPRRAARAHADTTTMELLPPAFELSGGGFAPGQALAPQAPHAHSSRRGTAAASALSNDVDGAVKKRWQEGLFRFMRCPAPAHPPAQR